MCALNYWDELYFVLVSVGTPHWTVHLSFFTFYILHCCYPHYQCFSSPPSFDVFSNNKFAWQLVNAGARLNQVRNVKYFVSICWSALSIGVYCISKWVGICFGAEKYSFWVINWSKPVSSMRTPHHLHRCLGCLGCTSQSVQCEANGSLCSRLLAHFLPSVSSIVCPDNVSYSVYPPIFHHCRQ